MKKWTMQSLVVFLLVCGSTLASAQTKTIKTDIFTVEYSETLQQPLKLIYTVECPMGGAKRSGISWYAPNNVITSDNDDYKNNEWDRGHLAPAAAFSCSKPMLKKTFTYLNCTLQHEGLNRGPWKELEEVERNLAMFYTVEVEIEVIFDNNPKRVPGGAAIPKAFVKTITIDHNEIYEYYFPNEDVAGQDWHTFGTEGNPVK